MLRSCSMFLVCAVLCVAWGENAAAQTPGPAGHKSALLIGVDTYDPHKPVKPPPGAPAKGRFESGLEYPDLKGPANDLVDMQGLLTSEKFGFPKSGIHLLKDAEATRDAILKAMNQYLVAGSGPGQPHSGDTVVLYISSHGSLRVNSQGDGQVYLLDGEPKKLDNTIVPADWFTGSEDITSLDLQEVLGRSAASGVHLTVILDSCHSGGAARGIDDRKFVSRDLGYDPRDAKTTPPALKAQDNKDNPVLILSAAQKDQSAIDVQSGRAHGMFTNALVHALNALPAGASANDVFQSVMREMEVDGAVNQQPALDSTAARKKQPLFGGAAASGPRQAVVLSRDDDGTVVLDVGKLADIGVGTIFKELNGPAAYVRVTDWQGIERSMATVYSDDTLKSPAGFKPKATDILVLEKWVPVKRDPLYFYTGAGLPLAQIQAAADAVHAAHLQIVSDPSSDPWTQTIAWDGKQWTLQAHGNADPLATAAKRPPVIPLGATLTPSALARQVPTNSVVWFNPPAPAELTRLPALADDASTAQLNPDRAKATYVLAGTLGDEGLSYAWYHRTGIDADEQTPKGYGRGCSVHSPYPLRTNWTPLAAGPQNPDKTAASQLSAEAANLAKLDSWLRLEASAGDATPFYYSLGLQNMADKKNVMRGEELTYKDQRYTLVLNRDPSSVGDSSKRWVYVLGIDCQGGGDILWPREGPGGKFPSENGALDTIPLPNLTFQITPPFGTDTYILLTTSSQLPEPDILKFESVVKGNTRSIESPLEQLLHAASSGTRGNVVVTPTNWGVQVLHTHSQPTLSPSP